MSVCRQGLEKLQLFCNDCDPWLLRCNLLKHPRDSFLCVWMLWKGRRWFQFWHSLRNTSFIPKATRNVRCKIVRKIIQLWIKCVGIPGLEKYATAQGSKDFLNQWVLSSIQNGISWKICFSVEEHFSAVSTNRYLQHHGIMSRFSVTHVKMKPYPRRYIQRHFLLGWICSIAKNAVTFIEKT